MDGDSLDSDPNHERCGGPGASGSGDASQFDDFDLGL